MERMAEVAEEIVEFASSRRFPGTEKWVAGHPIWDCNVGSLPSPKEAWYDRALLRKAVDNLLWIVERDKNPNFVLPRKDAIAAKSDKLLRYILDRFTVAKIAPKVTALREGDLLNLLKESGVALHNGVYCPMAGFGGIVRAAQKLSQEVEAYDINEAFCEWYGWERRDALAQVVETNKTVMTCPPFGKNYEHWKGTPKEMSDISFVEWTKLIKEHIKAPEYIFIGPQLKSREHRCGLFAKSAGIQIWTEEMLKNS